MSILFCPRTFIAETLDHLRSAGDDRQECVVLWLGHRSNGRIDVVEAYRPQQTSLRNQFHIPTSAIATLMNHLRKDRLMIAAQVHSHPAEAFHSWADDSGAIVRHVGALSFVIPWFAKRTNVDSFLHDTALYELQPTNEWLEVSFSLMGSKCQITN
jgi:proteasome lid subunit RPN8/RPN11